MISKIEVERFTLSSSKPFDQVVAALNSAVGHPDMAEFWKSTTSRIGCEQQMRRLPFGSLLLILRGVGRC